MTAFIHEPRARRWLGPTNQYQEHARASWQAERGTLVPWSWITTTCGLATCLEPDCMEVHAPKVIAYPPGVCIYCGAPAGTRDHLLPKPMSGEALRGLVAVVPACADCNSRIGDLPSPNVSDRRRIAHASILRSNKNLMAVPDKDAEDLAELGPGLRSVAIKNNAKRALVRLRLAWPEDPFMDLRAFQKSGIEDPVAIGMCDHPLTKEAA